MQISVFPVITLFQLFLFLLCLFFFVCLFSASINPVGIQGGMSILTMSVVQGTSDLLQCGPGTCSADTQFMPGFLQSRNSWIAKHRPLSFVTTFLVPGKHPLISPWLLLKAESTQTVGQGLQEGKKLYSFLISTCDCHVVWLQKINKSEVQCISVSPCESPLLLCASQWDSWIRGKQQTPSSCYSWESARIPVQV